MPDPITTAEITEARRLCEAATPGMNDASIVAAARTLLPHLLDEVERLHGLLDSAAERMAAGHYTVPLVAQRDQARQERDCAYLSGWRAGREAAVKRVECPTDSEKREVVRVIRAIPEPNQKEKP